MCVCIEQRDQKEGLTRERRKDGRVRPVSHYYRAVRGDPSIRPWTTVHHTGTLLPIVDSTCERFSSREESRPDGEGSGDDSPRCCAVSSPLSVYIYMYTGSFRLTSPGVTSGRDQGCREEESRKFNFDRRGGMVERTLVFLPRTGEEYGRTEIEDDVRN